MYYRISEVLMHIDHGFQLSRYRIDANMTNMMWRQSFTNNSAGTYVRYARLSRITMMYTAHSTGQLIVPCRVIRCLILHSLYYPYQRYLPRPYIHYVHYKCMYLQRHIVGCQTFLSLSAGFMPEPSSSAPTLFSSITAYVYRKKHYLLFCNIHFSSH